MAVKKKLIVILSAVTTVAGIGGVATLLAFKELPTCDGITIISECKDENGIEYTRYLYHAAEPEKSHIEHHPAEPAKTHIVNHPAEYGTRAVTDCIRTSISYKGGSCALSRCRDGSYSGSTGRGTCSYHGGVAYSGGPWYVEVGTETYLISAAWDEIVVDIPAKAAYDETIIDSPAREAYMEKVIAK